MHPFITRLTCLLLLSIGVSQAVADTMGEQWMIEEASGAVSIKSATGEMLSTQAGTQLIAPFTIVTGANGRVVVSHRLDRITVGENSQSTIALPRHTKAGLFTVIKQKLGSALYEVEHRVKASFEVDTPYLVSVVKGTTFNIHVTQSASSVSLVEGRLLVYTPDKKSDLMLTPGQAAIKSIHSKGIILKDQQSLSEPVQGRVTVVKDGSADVPGSEGATARLGGLENTPLTDIGNPADMARVPVDIGAGTNLDGSLNVGSSAASVPAGANVGSAGVTDLGGSVTTGGAGTLGLGASVPGASTGASTPSVPTSVNSVSGTVNIGTGAGTAASTGVGSAVGDVTKTVTSPLR